jgi:hypothetical protein
MMDDEATKPGKKFFHKNEEEQRQAWNKKVCTNQNRSSGQVIGLLGLYYIYNNEYFYKLFIAPVPSFLQD